MKIAAWRGVSGWEGWYEVSDRGEVRRVGRRTPMRLYRRRRGYLSVTLSRPGNRENRLVHTLVARAFLGEPQSGQQVNHRDADKTNNCVVNLEWTTQDANRAHAHALGITSIPVNPARGDQNGARLHPERLPRGSAHGMAKLTESDVVTIRSLRGKRTGVDVAEHFDVSPTLISLIQRRKIWRQVP